MPLSTRRATTLLVQRKAPTVLIGGQHSLFDMHAHAQCETNSLCLRSRSNHRIKSTMQESSIRQQWQAVLCTCMQMLYAQHSTQLCDDTLKLVPTCRLTVAFAVRKATE